MKEIIEINLMKELKKLCPECYAQLEEKTKETDTPVGILHCRMGIINNVECLPAQKPTDMTQSLPHFTGIF